MVHLFPPGPGHGVAKDMCRLCLPRRRQLWEHVTGAVAADFKNEDEYWGGGPSECTNVYEGSTGWAAQHDGGYRFPNWASHPWGLVTSGSCASTISVCGRSESHAWHKPITIRDNVLNGSVDGLAD